MTLFMKTVFPVLSDPEMDVILNGTSTHRPDMMEPQMPHAVVISLMVLSAAYVLGRCRLRDAWIIPATYVLTDLYMAVLHIYLDHPVTKASAEVPMLRTMANIFQHHHNYPIDVLYMNHVAGIDELNLATLAFPWILRLAAGLRGVKLPPQLHLMALCSTCFGILGAYNHVCMHARTHHLPIPPVVEWGQNMGFLPHNEFHRKHHTPPHDVNYAFLVGGSALYDALNTMVLRAVGDGPGQLIYYKVVQFLFALLQPFQLSSFVAAYYWFRGGVSVGSKEKSA